MSKTIAVFGGNGYSADKQKEYFPIAYDIGKILAEHGFAVVTGAGPGMMNEALRGAYEAGGHTIGIHLLKEGKFQSPYTRENFSFPEIKPRQQKFVEICDGFLVAPGGLGTIYEMIEIMVLKHVKEIPMSRPLIAVGPYYDGWKEYSTYTAKEGFIGVPIDSLITFCPTPHDAVEMLEKSFV